jgi:hypothetical protein
MGYIRRDDFVNKKEPERRRPWQAREREPIMDRQEISTNNGPSLDRDELERRSGCKITPRYPTVYYSATKKGATMPRNLRASEHNER